MKQNFSLKVYSISLLHYKLLKKLKEQKRDNSRFVTKSIGIKNTIIFYIKMSLK